MQKTLEILRRYLPSSLIYALSALPESLLESVQDIRIRASAPVGISLADGERYLQNRTSAEEITHIFYLLCGQAVHTHQEEWRHGFVTTAEGLRIGVAGEVMCVDEQIVSYRRVTSLCIRIPHRVIGCADAYLPWIVEERVRPTLLCGAPACGKTTILRELARLLSENGQRVAVVDERSELSAFGLPLCDVLQGMRKSRAVLQAVRTLSPDVVILDELGGDAEIEAVADSAFCGVPVIASIHAASLEELRARGSLMRLFENGAIERLIVLPPRNKTGGPASLIKVRDWLENMGSAPVDFGRDRRRISSSAQVKRTNRAMARMERIAWPSV
ncbi:MAG: Flp pilus assembly complex ATPase component TadA [Clostridia bacterium]|nr:Flp pilus assembly complex ATPase component TadA [Clostridia bacterium]